MNREEKKDKTVSFESTNKESMVQPNRTTALEPITPFGPGCYTLVNFRLILFYFHFINSFFY